MTNLIRFLCIPATALLLGGPAAQAQVAVRGGVFAEPHRATASADIALDGAGGLHMAYVHWEPEAEGAAAVYASCAGGVEACADFGAWRTVELMPAAQRVQVAVTADGRPRLLITGTSRSQSGALDHSYAECDAGCDQAANWTVTPVASSWDTSMSAIMAGDLPQRSFVLDPWGRPQFLYSDRNYLVEPDHYGTFWMTCKAGCSDRANWRETDLARHSDYDTEIFDTPALALTPDGRPRVASRIFALPAPGDEAAREGLYYLACDSGCTRPEGWRRVWITEAGSGSYPSPTWDLAVDAQGRPRIAFFAGAGMAQADLSHSLIYLWCDAGDCLSEEAWNGSVVAGEGHGEASALALDGQGRPRMALRTAGGELGYAWCDEGCETPEGVWQAVLVEGQGELQAERPTALPFTCDGELWNGLAPQLALRADGRPVVAYNLSVQGRCLYHERGTPEEEIYYDFNEVWRGARLVGFAP